MDQHGQNGPSGPGGRRFHIAHRRSPSELTPLMMEQLALAQQIELLQQQQQQIAATHQQYVNLGMIQPQQQLPNQAFAQMQGQIPNNNAFQFPQQQQQQQQHLQLPGSMGPPAGHRRNQSAMPNMTMGPPPAPSAGSSGPFGEFSFPGAKTENVNPRPRNSGSISGGSGHSRRHSLALPEAKKAAEIAEQKRKQSGFQFPVPGAAGAAPDRAVSPGNANNDMPPPANNFSARNSGRGGHGRSQSLAVGTQRTQTQRGGPAFQFPPPGEINNVPERRGSQGHGRTQSRNFDGNWRQQQPTIQEQHATNMGNFQMNQHAGAQPFQPGHRQRGSVNSQSISSISNFQFPQQPQLVQLPQGQVLMQPNMFATQGLNALQLAQIQAYQAAGLQAPIAGLQGQQGGQQMTMQQQQQQRKTLFTPYLPQATLPALSVMVNSSQVFFVSTRKTEVMLMSPPMTSTPTSSFAVARTVTVLLRAILLLSNFLTLMKSGVRSARRKRRRSART